MRYLPSRILRVSFLFVQSNLSSSAPISAKYGATISGVTSSILGGDHFGLRSLSITAARTPSRKSSLANTSNAARYSRTRHSSSEGDARGYDVALTDAGRAAFQAAWPSYVAGIRHCFADVLSPDQLDALTDIAETIDRHFTAQHCPGGLNDPAKADGARTTAAGLEFCTAEDSLESAC